MRAIAIVLVLAGGAAYADDPKFECREPSPGAKIVASFKPGISVRELVIWAGSFTCKSIVFDAGIATRATKLVIVSPREMSPKQAMQLFVDALDAVGLVVVDKTDTIIIKPGPGMPKTCPDVAESAPLALPPAFSDADAKVLDAGIRKIDDSHYEVSAAARDIVVREPMQASKGARIVQAIYEGKPQGFKTYAIRPGSLWARLGLQNGDTIMTVNGYALDSPERALEVYSKLRDATAIEIELVRHGTPVKLMISITTR